MGFVIVNEMTGRIVGPELNYEKAETFCETIETKGKHVAPVVFSNASGAAILRIMRLRKTWKGKRIDPIAVLRMKLTGMVE